MRWRARARASWIRARRCQACGSRRSTRCVAAAGGIAPAIATARARHPELLLEVEVESLDELATALRNGADRVLLDDFTPAMLREAVALAAGRVPLEVSGSVDLARVRAIAESGVDYISVGALTKHIHAIDLSMRFE